MATSTMNTTSTTTGMKTFNDQVWSSHTNSQWDGMSRSMPSAKPMYQSGCVPAETGDGSYGPYSQIGLIVKNEAISATTPKTMKKNPPAFAA